MNIYGPKSQVDIQSYSGDKERKREKKLDIDSVKFEKK